MGGRPFKALYQYALTDQNIDELNTWAPKLVNKLRDYPQIKDATSDQQFRGLQENVVIDRDAAARLGIQPQAVDSTLYSAFGQRQVSIIYTQQNQYHVVWRWTECQLDPTSLDKIYVKSSTGKPPVPLSTSAHFEPSNTPLGQPPGAISVRHRFVQHRARRVVRPSDGSPPESHARELGTAVSDRREVSPARRRFFRRLARAQAAPHRRRAHRRL